MIYLLRTSPHNEEFNLDGYAVDDAGLMKLAINEVKEYFWIDGYPEPTAVIDWETKIVTATLFDNDGSVDYEKDFYISVLEQVQ